MAVRYEGTAAVKIDGQDADFELQKITKRATELRKELLELKKSGNANFLDVKEKENELKRLNQEARSLKKNMFDYNKVVSNLSGASIKELNTLYNKLNFEIRSLTRGTEEYAAKAALIRKVNAEIAATRAEMKQLNNAQESFWKKLTNGFNNYFGMIATFSASLMGVAFGMKETVAAANEYEKIMDSVQSLTGLTNQQMQGLSQTAKDFSTQVDADGIRITQSADDILQAFKKIGGQRPELLANADALSQVTKDAIILSQAAEMELEPAAKAVAAVLNQMELNADQSRRAINALGAGAKTGAGEIDYLTEVFYKAGNSANSLDLSLEQVVAMAETLAPHFESPERAGTNLKNVFLTLSVSADEFNPKIVGLQTALDNLSEANLSSTEILNMFGRENIDAARILIESRKEVEYYTEAVTGTNIAVEQAIINTDNNAAKLAQARNEIHLNAITLGEKLSPALTMSTNAFNYLLKALVHVVENWKIYGNIIKLTLGPVLAYTVVTKAAATAKWLYIAAVKAATAAQKAFAAAAKTNPWGLIAAAVTLVVTAIVVFGKELNKVASSLRQFNREVAKEQAHVELLFSALKNTNEATQARRDLITQINEKYGEYLPKLLTEKSTLQEIEAAQVAVNNAIVRNLALKQQSQELEEILSERLYRERRTFTAVSGITDKSQAEIMQAFEQYSKGGTGIAKSVDMLNSGGGQLDQGEINSTMVFFEKLASMRKNEEDQMKAIRDAFEPFMNQGLTAQDQLPNVNPTVFQKYTQSSMPIGEVSEETETIGGDFAAQKAEAESLAEYIRNLNSELIEDERAKALEEVEIWRAAQEQKIADSTAVETEKQEALTAINSVYTQRRAAIDAEYEKQKTQALQRAMQVIAAANEGMELSRTQIIAREVEAIREKYQVEIDLLLQYEGTAAEVAMLEKARDAETKEYLARTEEEFQKRKLELRRQYGLVLPEEDFAIEMRTLQQQYEEKLLTEEEYQKAKADITKKYQDSVAEKERATKQSQYDELYAGFEFQKQLTAAFSDFFAAQKEMELQLAGDNEEKKKEIAKKYAAKEFLIKLSNIAADTAMGIMKAYAQGGVFATPMAILIGATGLVQAATVTAEMLKIKKLSSGGFTGSGTIRDDTGHRVAGIVHENEYVVPQHLMLRPDIAGMVHIIEQHRTANTTAPTIPASYATGGYTQAQETTAQNNDLVVMLLSELLAESKKPKKNYVVQSEVEATSLKIENSKKNSKLW